MYCECLSCSPGGTVFLRQLSILPSLRFFYGPRKDRQVCDFYIISAYIYYDIRYRFASESSTGSLEISLRASFPYFFLFFSFRKGDSLGSRRRSSRLRAYVPIAFMRNVLSIFDSANSRLANYYYSRTRSVPNVSRRIKNGDERDCLALPERPEHNF